MRNHVSAAEKQARAKDKSHFCSVCGKGFKAVANLLTHKCRGSLSAMDGSRPHIRERCPVCQSLFSSKDSLLEHLRDHHYNNEREKERERYAQQENHMRKSRETSTYIRIACIRDEHQWSLSHFI